MFVVKSWTGRPTLSNPQVSTRSCSIFSCARAAVYVDCIADAFPLVERMNICAVASTPPASKNVAINVSRSEKPDALLREKDFAKSIYRDSCGVAGVVTKHRERETVRRN